MSRIQLALNVDDLDEAVSFYSKLFNTAPAKLKDGYANFAIAEPPLKLVLLHNPGKGGTLNHLGMEVESSDQVHAEIARLAGEGLVTEEQIGTTCCFATQDKVWVSGPGGERWEVYTVLAELRDVRHHPGTTCRRSRRRLFMLRLRRWQRGIAGAGRDDDVVLLSAAPLSDTGIGVM